jgi:tryptophan-rich sensory protein
MDKPNEFLSIRFRTLVNAILAFYVIFITYQKMHSVLPWYYTLKLSTIQPPSWVFSVAWGYIYASWFFILGYIFFNFQKLDTIKTRSFLTLFLLNILAQFIWINLFTKHDLFNSLFALVASLIFSWLMVSYGYKIGKSVGYMLLPQAIWLVLAAILGLQTFLLNKY